MLTKPPVDALVCLCALLERTDLSLTLQQLAVGDRADILQTTRWQAEMFARPPLNNDPAAPVLAQAAQTFVDAYGARQADHDDYAAMLRAGLTRFRELDAGTPAELQRFLAHLEEALTNDDAVDHTQGAHRRVLAHLQRVIDG